ncbi:MAG: pilus assembly protein [Rhodobacteraceae bacterium]|nr:MAG: pilus assembly protein [Paracoccaceae bacterium]
MFIRKILNRLKAFRDDTRGSVTVEFAMMMPLLFWAYGASYVFFDAYRQSAVNLKAAYTIGDLVSRETRALNEAYIDSLYNMTQLLTRTNSPLSMRITVVRWDADDDMYYFDWSKARGSVQPMTQNDLDELEARLPTMPDQERVIVVETWNTWTPPFNVGMTKTDIDNFVFTRPRFAPQVVFQ